jgi:polyisoprenoid-binding protein YceI
MGAAAVFELNCKKTSNRICYSQPKIKHMNTEAPVKRVKWSIDPVHSEITFKVRHLMIAHVKGSFKTFDASIYTTGNDFTTAEIDIWIDAASISTGNADRDAHLTGSDFFDAAHHKQITFVCDDIEKADAEGNHEVWGNLCMKGVTRKIQLNVQYGGIVHDPWGNERAGFTVTGKINRSEWALAWNKGLEAGGFMVSEEVTIACELELVSSAMEELQVAETPEVDSRNIL